MNKILIYFINIIIAIAFINYFIYIRLFIIRLPKDLYMYENGIINYNIIFLTLVGLAVSIYLLKQNIFFNKNTPGLISKTLNKFITYLENALQQFHDLIVSKIPNNFEKMSYIAKNFYYVFGQKSETLFLFIIFAIRIIILIAFLIDVFIFFRLNYMYKTLYLLCISLLIKLFFYLLRNFSYNLEQIKSVLVIENQGIDKETSLPVIYYELKEGSEHLNLRYYVQAYILCSKLTGYLNVYDRYSHYFILIFNIFIYSLYLAGWSYILLVNFFY